MKSFAVILYAAGLVSAVNLAQPIVQNGAIDPNLLNNSSLAINGSSANVGNLGSADLGNLNLGNVNLGSINLNDPNSLAQGIELIMNSLCLGNLIDENSLLSLGLNNELDLFLEMAQLAQLEALGFLNVGSIQSLVQSNLLFGGGLNSLNLGVFKREAAGAKKGLRRSKLRRNATKRQCQSAEVPTLSVAPSDSSAPPPADANASAAPAEAAAPPPPAASSSSGLTAADGEPLSDFTK